MESHRHRVGRHRYSGQHLRVFFTHFFQPLLSIKALRVGRRGQPKCPGRLHVAQSRSSGESALRFWRYLNNVGRKLLLHGLAAKNPSGQWAFTGSRSKQAGPHNPHVVGEQSNRTKPNKPALVVVTRAGVIRLLYQGPDSARWLDFQTDLESVSTAEGLLTHATICAETGSFIWNSCSSVSSDKTLQSRQC